MWQWIRNQVRDAVLAGVADAMQQLGQDATAAEAAGELRERLALPAPEPEAEPARRRKG